MTMTGIDIIAMHYERDNFEQYQLHGRYPVEFRYMFVISETSVLICSELYDWCLSNCSDRWGWRYDPWVDGIWIHFVSDVDAALYKLVKS